MQQALLPVPVHSHLSPPDLSFCSFLLQIFSGNHLPESQQACQQEDCNIDLLETISLCGRPCLTSITMTLVCLVRCRLLQSIVHPSRLTNVSLLSLVYDDKPNKGAPIALAILFAATVTCHLIQIRYFRTRHLILLPALAASFPL